MSPKESASEFGKPNPSVLSLQVRQRSSSQIRNPGADPRTNRHDWQNDRPVPNRDFYLPLRKPRYISEPNPFPLL